MEIIVNQVEKRSWTEIDLKQVESNYHIYKSSLKKEAKIMAVIKADAYGHGDIMIAKTLSQLGVDMFAVSNIDEAVGLRNSGIEGEILILGYTSPKYAKTLSYLDLTQAIVSEEYAEELAKTKYSIKCHIALDTGMTRIGINAQDSNYASSQIERFYDKLNITGLFTHLCVADSFELDDREYTKLQLERFKNVVDKVAYLDFPHIHCYNSAGGLYYLEDNDFNNRIGNIVRLGIVLYGLKPERDNILPDGIKPVMTWKSVVSMVKNVPAGQSIGYGRAYITQSKSRIATITTGYADGYSRHLSNMGYVLIDGHKAPIVGRVCMDQILVDVTALSNVKMGSTVVLLGDSRGVTYNADDMAFDLGTIGYEVICGITKRVQRFYV